MPVRGIIRGYIFTDSRTDLLRLFRLVNSNQISPMVALGLTERFVVQGKALPDYLPPLVSDRPVTPIGEN